MALTTEKTALPVVGSTLEQPAAASKLYMGGLVGVNTSGYARPFTLGDSFRGLALATCNNTGGTAGGKNVRTTLDAFVAEVELSGVAITHARRGAAVYAQDDGTLSLRAGLMVGRVVMYIRSGVALVAFDPNPAIGILAETVLIGGFTDNSNTTGYIDLVTQLPRGATVLGWEADVKTGFTGDTTAILQVGVAGTLARFSAITSTSVLAAAVVGCQAPGATSSTFLTADTTVRLTVTGSSDFGLIAAGELDIKLKYLPPTQ